MDGGEGAPGAAHAIGVVARRTGLSEHTLRAWERRYGVVEPVRSEGGQRLYTEADVLRLRLLRRATEAGHPIGRVAHRTAHELLDLAISGDADREPPSSDGRTDVRLQQIQDSCLAAARAHDGAAVHEALMRAVVLCTPSEFVGRVAVPLLRQVGALWAAGELRPAQEHVLSVNLRRVLGWLTESFPAAAGAPTLIASTLQGQQHEFGSMLAGVVAAEEGWRVAYLGPDLPPAEIAAAAIATGAAAVALSAVGAGAERALTAELGALRAALPQGVALLVGGAAAGDAADALRAAGVTVLTDFGALRSALRALYTPGGEA